MLTIATATGSRRAGALGAKMTGVNVPAPRELLQRVRALPAAGPLLAHLGSADGVSLVGGAVRDLLLGGEPRDLDLVVEVELTEVASRLAEPVELHDRFGTARVVLDGLRYDIARARGETYAHPGALPAVHPADLEQDLQRRDFTVNAAAIRLGGPQAGTLVAAAPALGDLDARRLRVLHDRSFIDDPTRLLRLARYVSRLAFAIEPHTRELAAAAVHAGAMQTVSGPRIGTELALLAAEADPVVALRSLRTLGLDEAITPGWRVRDDGLGDRALSLLAGAGDRTTLALAAALFDVPHPELARLLATLGLPAARRDLILDCVQRARSVARALAAATSGSEIAAAVAGAPPEVVALAGALGPSDAAAQWIGSLRHVALEIGGADLVAAGIPPGPAVGRGLRAALAARLDGSACGREAELARALQAARDSG
jgi:tRNA nucleotidyltransferase (CCA-adding enzyme)